MRDAEQDDLRACHPYAGAMPDGIGPSSGIHMPKSGPSLAPPTSPLPAQGQGLRPVGRPQSAGGQGLTPTLARQSWVLEGLVFSIFIENQQFY